MTDTEIKDLCDKLDELWKKFHTYAPLVRLMDNTQGITYISSGSSRKVYKLNDDVVLKLAKNKKGSGQNYVEADWALPKYGCVADWYKTSDEDNIWILSELCPKARISDFSRLLGVSWQNYIEYVKYICADRNPAQNRNNMFKPEQPEQFYDWIEREDLLGYIYSYIGDYNPPVGDLIRISSYGINHDGDIVLIDSGLNDRVFDTFYKRK